jgi:hypothetical protein
MRASKSGPAQHSIDLLQRLAHLLFYTLDTQPRLLGNLGIAQSVNPVCHENLASFWAEAHYGRLKAIEHIARFKQASLIGSGQ